MPIKNQSTIQLSKLLGTLSSVSLKMFETLEAEHKALTSHDNKDLSKLTPEKKQLSTLLEKHTRTLHKHLLTTGVSKGIYNLKQHISTLPSADDKKHLLHLWETIKKATEENKELNESNGAIVELSRRHSQRSLDILRGQVSAPTAKTYGSDGYASKGSASRKISIA